jgi:hypothetical protein
MKALILRRNVFGIHFMRKTLSPKTSLRVITPLVRGTSTAMMLDQGFSIRHEAREGTRRRENPD